MLHHHNNINFILYFANRSGAFFLFLPIFIGTFNFHFDTVPPKGGVEMQFVQMYEPGCNWYRDGENPNTAMCRFAGANTCSLA